MNSTVEAETSAEGRGILDATSYSLRDLSRTSDTDPDESNFLDQNVLQLMDEPFSQLVDGMQLRKNDRYSGFDNNAGSSWIYPTNLPVRKYQFAITKAALFKNTLVVLPTGLGKTFIAAVVMYNILRWYPRGKVIFMAPTKPLVNQQIEACYKIMGIPKSDTAEMTGKQKKSTRPELWKSKRVFFVTPQVVQADIHAPGQHFPTDEIKLIVIDEAHKAKGRYAYTEVVKAIAETNKNFRILALSATPGRTLEDVAQVIQNLMIAHIEVRWENSIDVSPYSFKKNIQTVVIPLGVKITKIRDEYIQIVDPYVRRLLDANAISGRIRSLSKGWLIMEQRRFREANLINKHRDYVSINTDFSTCISLYHALDLLTLHGVRSFLNFFEDENNRNQEKYFVAKDLRLKVFLKELWEEYGRNPLGVFNAIESKPGRVAAEGNFNFGHPKFDILAQKLKDHFQNNPDSKVIIFCEFRDSVAMIHRMLQQNRPLIKPKCIVGQGGTTGGLRAVSQKEQIAAMKDFRTGVCNTLIATCVAEEGIDIGSVDLIICFDTTKNPVRFVQRIGRTGRQRTGKVLMLVTEGREHDTLKEVMSSKDKTNQKLARSREILNVLYRHSPRLVPTEFDPKCVETWITIPAEEEESAEQVTAAVASTSRDEGGTRKRKTVNESPPETTTTMRQNTGRSPKSTPKRKRWQGAPIPGTQDLRNFFRKVDAELDREERGVFDTSTGSVDTSLDPISTGTVTRGQKVTLENEANPLFEHIAKIEEGKYIEDKQVLTHNADDLLNSNNCNNSLKKLLLMANLERLNRTLEICDILQAVNDDKCEDIVMLNDQGECVKSEVRAVEVMFGGRDALKKRVADAEEYRSITNAPPSSKNQRYTLRRDYTAAERMAAFDEGFGKFCDHEEQSNKLGAAAYRIPVQAVPSSGSRSSLFDSQLNVPSIIEPEESWYQPQMGNSQSRPSHTTFLKPKKSKPDYANSSILRAFNISSKSDQLSSPTVTRVAQLDACVRSEFCGRLDLGDSFYEISPKPAENRAGDKENFAKQAANASRSLFDSREPSQEKSAFPMKPEDTLTSKEIAMLEANFIEEDFSPINLPRNQSPPADAEIEYQIPISQFLRENFPEDITQEKLTDGGKSQKKEASGSLDLTDMFTYVSPDSTSGDVVPDSQGEHTSHKCEAKPDVLPDTTSDEVIPNSQEEPLSHKFKPKPSLEKLHIGNVDDLFADSDDDLFCDIKSPDPHRSASIRTQHKDQVEPMPTYAEKSPELLRKKLNFNRLHLAKASDQATSTPIAKHHPHCSYFVGSHRIPPTDVKVNSPIADSFEDQSRIGPPAKRRAIIEDSEDDQEDVLSVHSLSASSSMEPSLTTTSKKSCRRKRRKRNHHAGFVLTQAVASDEDGDDGDGDHDDDDELSNMIDDSVVDHGPIGEDSVDMRAKYLQSVRSPPIRGIFKIPSSSQVRCLNPFDIYSQIPIHDQHSMYEDSSFIVQEDEVEESGDSSESDELERAEAILRQRRREKKRQGQHGNSNAKQPRRRIISLDSSDNSDEEPEAFR
ncbi:uncharacterized protein LOC129767689 isoform X2 [Toxorhynchites rutilus septentrionalis]|nr:uncharacterized protein LOC129767689 isoform X2 [Toxorhynchites rutilus septentrionalis]